MQINKKETYAIEELTKEELLFILEVIEKLQLTTDSSSISFEIANKFKTLRQELLPTPDEKSSCDGCESTVDIEDKLCPIQGVKLPLCPICYLHRKHYLGAKNVKPEAN